jgi:nucleoside-diphosphate-sugar epimerase
MGHEHVMPQFIRKLIKNEEFSVEGDGTETRSFCFIDDAIDATLLVNNDDSFKNRIFNIGNDVETSISDLLELLSKISGKDIEPKFKPKDHAGTKRRVPEISKARSVGYTPKITLKDGLRITYDWYSKYYREN